MDEILTRWATDLTKYTKEFRSTAETVATWDQHLVDNMSKISKLYSQTLIAERQTESVEMQLNAVESQQAELESWLSVYEKQVDEMLEREGKGQGEVGGPDSEREKTYRLSEKLGERLEEMGTDLEGMVGEINAANSLLSRNGKQDEPVCECRVVKDAKANGKQITQIVKILNSHLTQLKVIDDGAAALNAKVEKAQKSLGSLAYSNGSMNTNGTAAVDDFYKSYLGKRG
jgi:nuclear pore complex protein Nup62